MSELILPESYKSVYLVDDKSPLGLDDLWTQALNELFKHGSEYTIDRGSYEGQRRLQFKFFTAEVRNPGFQITPIMPSFAESIAPSTSIGKGGENLIRLCKQGKVKILDNQLPQNIGKMVTCTNQPEYSRKKELEDIVTLSKQETIALIFGIDQRSNKMLKKIKEESYCHLDITNNKIRLSLDSEIGAVCHSFFMIRKA